MLVPAHKRFDRFQHLIGQIQRSGTVFAGHDRPCPCRGDMEKRFELEFQWFFFVALHIVALVRVLMVKGTGIATGISMSVAVAALILGKAVLLADLLPFLNRYPTQPLIYNGVWKTALYTLVACLIHYVEHLVDCWRQTGSLVTGNRQLLAEIVWPHFLAIQILLIVMIFSYCTIRELARVLGRDQLLEMFFGIRPRARVSPHDRFHPS